MELKEVLEKRRTIRRYQPGREVPRELIQEIVEAGMLAPNAANRRPWEFFVLENKESISRVVNAHPNGKMLQDCSALIIVCGSKERNKPMPEPFLYLDCAASITQMLLRATDLGLGCGWLGAYPDPQKMADIQDLLQTEAIPVATMVLGYADEAPKARGFFDGERLHFVDQKA